MIKRKKINITDLNQIIDKQSIKRNMTESFLVKLGGNKTNELKKQPTIVESDVKLFNFLLDSSYTQENSEVQTFIQKNNKQQSPHLNLGGEQLHFSKKRKNKAEMKSIKNSIRQQFQKLIMDESLRELEFDDIEQFNSLFNYDPTHFLVTSDNINFNQNNKNFTDLHQRQSRFNQEGKKIENQECLFFKNCLQNSISQKEQGEKYNLHPKNRMSVQQKQLAPFAKQLHQNSKRDYVFQSHNNYNTLFYQSNRGELNIINKRINKSKNNKLINCQCRQIKIWKNLVHSKVINFVFVPRSSRRRNFQLSPKKLNLSFNHSSKTPQKYKNKNQKQQKNSQNTGQRKPAFLKLLNNKKYQEKNVQTNINSLQSIQKQMTVNMKNQEKTRKSSVLQKQKRQSIMIGFNDIQSQHLQSKSTNKSVQKINHTKLSSSHRYGERENFNSEINGKYKLGQPCAHWQTTTNLNQKLQFTSLNIKRRNIDIINPKNRKNIYPNKVKSPKQVQYLSSNSISISYQNYNNAHSNIHDLNIKQKQINPQILKSQQKYYKPFMIDGSYVLRNNQSNTILKSYTNIS